MNVIHLSLSHLFPAISLQEKAIVIFYAKWQPKALAKLINGLNQYPANNIEEIIAVQSVGGDDVESYVVDVLQVNVLPFIAIFNRKTLIGGGPSWIDVLQHLYLFRKPEIHWRKFQNEVDYISLLLGNFASNTLTLEDRSNDCLQLFISGDRSSVGKSTISLMILACLVSRGVPPENLAYIKPVTQCEAVQPVTKYCQSVGIETIEVSPIVFYQGFTRAYLAGETETAIEMLHRIRTVVSSISEGKRLVVIDGVGYPSVGSICSISNADVAQYLQAPVLLVGKSGVGDAVDSYNLLATFFEYHRVRVLGGIFNKIELEGFYSLENCKRSLSSYFLQRKPHQMPYGFMPKTTAFRGLEHLMIVDNGAESIDQLLLNGWLNVFLQHVDLQRIIFDTWMVKVTRDTQVVASSSGVNSFQGLADKRHTTMRNHQPEFNSQSTAMDISVPSIPSIGSMPTENFASLPPLESNSAIWHPGSIDSTSETTAKLRAVGNKRSRDEIEGLSQSQGAKRQQ